MVNDYLKGVGDKPFTNALLLQAWSLRRYKRKVSNGERAKLSATVLGWFAGASAPTILDQFLNEKEGIASLHTKTVEASGRFAVVPQWLMANRWFRA
jgi:hypothetical protein